MKVLAGLSHSPKAPHQRHSRMPIEDLSLLQGPRGDMYAIRERCSSAEHRDQQFIEGERVGRQNCRMEMSCHDGAYCWFPLFGRPRRPGSSTPPGTATTSASNTLPRATAGLWQLVAGKALKQVGFQPWPCQSRLTGAIRCPPVQVGLEQTGQLASAQCLFFAHCCHPSKDRHWNCDA